MLTAHLIDMRNYMPAEHRALIAAVEAMPSIRPIAPKQSYNAVLARGYADQHSAWRARVSFTSSSRSATTIESRQPTLSLPRRSTTVYLA